MQAARKFCALRKSVYVVNHTNGIIRLDNWKKDMNERVANEIKEVTGSGWAQCKKKCHYKTLKKPTFSM